jgi:hypothetical protein
MKRSRLGSLIAAGAVAAATIILAAPAASARPVNRAQNCGDMGGRYATVPHYEFDTNGNARRAGSSHNCTITYPDGSRQTVWYD